MLDNIRVTINTAAEHVRLNLNDTKVVAAKISADAGNIIERKTDGLFAPTPAWDALEDKPVSTVNDIDQAVDERHTHANKSVIDDLSDNAGALEYRGLPVSDQAALDAKVDKVSGYSLVADTEIEKLSTVEQYAQKNTVSSVAGKQGDVLLDKSDVGLSAVDNTADADKPVSTSVADALADKVDKEDGMGLSELSFTTVDKLSLDQSEQDRHTHSNKTVIDDLSDDSGVLQYKGLPISDQAALDAKVDKVAGYSLVDDAEIAKLVTVQENATANRADSENADKVHDHTVSQVVGLSDRLDSIDSLIGDVESVLIAINGEP